MTLFGQKWDKYFYDFYKKIKIKIFNIITLFDAFVGKLIHYWALNVHFCANFLQFIYNYKEKYTYFLPDKSAVSTYVDSLKN